MNTAVAPKMPSLALAAKNNTSGPISRVSLSAGLSFRLAAMLIQSDHGAGEVARGEGRQVVDAFADADIVNRQAKFCRDGDQDAAARGAVELGHHQAGDAGDFAEDIDLVERV